MRVARLKVAADNYVGGIQDTVCLCFRVQQIEMSSSSSSALVERIENSVEVIEPTRD